MKTSFTILFVGALFCLSTAQDCLSVYKKRRCIPKAEAGSTGLSPHLYKDGDICFPYYGSTYCYVRHGGKEYFEHCDKTSPGCSGSGSAAQDCMSTKKNKRCIPKAEAGSVGQHSALFQDGDPCFTYSTYGTICYLGGGSWDRCSKTSPGCSGGDCPNQAAYCDAFGNANTMCKYCGIGDTCKDEVFTNEMTDAMKLLVLKKHNDLRAKVALGYEHGQPSAQNMNKLEWDDELARNAQLWADQCPDPSWVKTTNPPHDQDRRTIVYDGSIGQNMAASFYTNDRKDWKNWKRFLNRKVNSWYNEVSYWPAANVGSWSEVGATGDIGHYTQIVWAETKKVGCGVVYYKDPNKIIRGRKYPYRKELVCNYWPAGNFKNEPVYKKGTTAAACTNGSENGLCL